MSDYKDTDSMLMKQQLNAIYGAGITHAFPCRRSFIVVHTNKSTGVVFKDKIVAVNNDNGKATISLVTGDHIYSEDKYASIIKELI